SWRTLALHPEGVRDAAAGARDVAGLATRDRRERGVVRLAQRAQRRAIEHLDVAQRRVWAVRGTARVDHRLAQLHAGAPGAGVLGRDAPGLVDDERAAL